MSGASSEAVEEITSYQYTETYSYSEYGFSFKYPRDFTVGAIVGDGHQTILVQNLTKKIGVQILITPFDGKDIDITPEIVQQDIPDIKINDAQEILIGENRKGLAFLSDNKAFGGKSREVWFVYKGNLYQISTYAEFDEFLKGLFTTWQFAL